MTSSRTAAAALAALIGALAPASARAQVQPGMPTGPTQGPQPEKPEGVAEQAPKTPGALPSVPVLPPPKGKAKKFQVFQLDGYFRFRTDWHKQFDLGFADDPMFGGAPYPNRLGCRTTLDACEGRQRSANMRLRLEPIIHLDEKASVHLQVDILDNLVLGSTPSGQFLDGTVAPGYDGLSAFSDGTAPPQAGRNASRDSIVVKRAWAEVMTPLGLLKFGRQPMHWGLGLLHNAGGRDPITGAYDLDSDYGDTVDRLLFGANIPGTDFSFNIATDWSLTTPTSGQTNLFYNELSGGQPFDLDDEDDITQWVFNIAKLDSPVDFQDKRDQGELVLNYGAQIVWRKQRFATAGPELGGSIDDDIDSDGVLTTYATRGLELYIPDVFVRMGWKNILLEAEALWVTGSIDSLDDLLPDGDPRTGESFDVSQLGGVLRAGFSFMDDELELGLETGFASGDSWDNTVEGRTHVRYASPLLGGSDTSFDAFRFDFDYEVDLILFRELIGTVTNAIYVKPTLRYDLTDRLTFRGQSVISFAHKPVATPGNSSMYGVELDGDLGYENNGFFAGISYGVLFPLGALDHPSSTNTGSGAAFPFGDTTDNAGDAQTAQTIQMRLVLQF